VVLVLLLFYFELVPFLVQALLLHPFFAFVAPATAAGSFASTGVTGAVNFCPGSSAFLGLSAIGAETGAFFSASFFLPYLAGVSAFGFSAGTFGASLVFFSSFAGGAGVAFGASFLASVALLA